MTSDTKGIFISYRRGEAAAHAGWLAERLSEHFGEHTVFRDMSPVVVTMTLATNPAGLQIKLDEQPQSTPHTVSTVVGITRTLSAVSPQLLNGQWYEFESWSDGGAATHTVNGGGTFVANYKPLAVSEDEEVRVVTQTTM